MHGRLYRVSLRGLLLRHVDRGIRGAWMTSSCLLLQAVICFIFCRGRVRMPLSRVGMFFSPNGYLLRPTAICMHLDGQNM